MFDTTTSTYQAPPPFEASIEGQAVGPDALPNTVTVSVITSWEPTADDNDDNDGTSQDTYADAAGERQLVEIDTNYKATRPGAYPVHLTRTDAIHLAACLLAAVADTFHPDRYGRLRATEAAQLLTALAPVEDELHTLRQDALDDLLDDTGHHTTPDQQAGSAGAVESEPADQHSALSGTTTHPTQDEHQVDEPVEDPTDVLSDVTGALRAVFPPELADAVEDSEAFGALIYRWRQRVAATGRTPVEVLRELDPDDLAFAAYATDPAAFLAAKIRDLT